MFDTKLKATTQEGFSHLDALPDAKQIISILHRIEPDDTRGSKGSRARSARLNGC